MSVFLPGDSNGSAGESVSVVEPDSTAVFGPVDLARSVVFQICSGEFGKAGESLAALDSNELLFSELHAIVSDYNSMELSRRDVRSKALIEQYAELEKLKVEAEVNEPNLIEIFPVVLKIQSLSGESDKSKILGDTFVKSAIERSILEANGYESEGRWFDSLLRCYSWLTLFDEDNKAYQEHKEELTEKVLIKSSLMDSPCEDHSERYRFVADEMLIRGLDVLEYAYVEPFYYRDMADESLGRCKNLAEVLRYSDSFDDSFTIEFSDANIPAFIAGIDSFAGQVKHMPMGISKDTFIRLFRGVLSLNESTLGLPREVLLAHFSEAALGSLDPHTMIIWPKQVSDFDKNMTNEFSGVGIEISKADGPLKATSLLPGTPAYAAGLDAGDIIEAIDGQSTRDMSINCAVSKITGPAGTDVVLTIRRQGVEELMDFKITRARIVVPTIRGWRREDSGKWQYIVDDSGRIGYVRITSFSGTTAKDFEKVLKKLESGGLGALIIDLRYNSGGYLQTAADIVDMFVSEGVIVSSQPRLGLPSWEPAHKKGTHPDYPLVILINGGSASASEIVAGALADKAYRRAVLVGEQSYGKGSVQTITGYTGGNSQMKYTMAHYHLPSGDKVKSRFAMKKQGRKDWGIFPDVEVKMNSAELKKFIDIQRDNDVLVGAGHDNGKVQIVRHDIDETLGADHQLAVAVLVAKAKLVEQKVDQLSQDE